MTWMPFIAYVHYIRGGMCSFMQFHNAYLYDTRKKHQQQQQRQAKTDGKTAGVTQIGRYCLHLYALWRAIVENEIL